MSERQQEPALATSVWAVEPLADWIRTLFEAFRRWAETRTEHHFQEFLQLAEFSIRGSIRRVLASRAGDRDLVADLMQETYLKLCAANGSSLLALRNSTPLGVVAYLRAVAHNTATDYFRSQLALRRSGQLNHVSLDEANPKAFAIDNGSTERALLLDKVRRCLEERSKKTRDRAIFWLYFRQGQTTKAIASTPAVNLSQKGVESVLRQLIHLIQECVKGKLPLTTSEKLES